MPCKNGLLTQSHKANCSVREMSFLLGEEKEGDRDSFLTPAEVCEYKKSPSSLDQVVPGGGSQNSLIKGQEFKGKHS